MSGAAAFILSKIEETEPAPHSHTKQASLPAFDRVIRKIEIADKEPELLTEKNIMQLNARTLALADDVCKPINRELGIFIKATGSEALGMASKLGTKCLDAVDKLARLLEAGSNNLEGIRSVGGYEPVITGGGQILLIDVKDKLEELGSSLRSVDDSLRISLSELGALKKVGKDARRLFTEVSETAEDAAQLWDSQIITDYTPPLNLR